MTKFPHNNLPKIHTPQYKTHYLHSSRRTSGCKQKTKKDNQRTPSQSTSDGSKISSPEQQIVQHQNYILCQKQIKYMVLVHIQTLMIQYQYDVFAYCMMIEIVKKMNFTGTEKLGLKVAVSVFYIGSKFFDSKAPRLTDLLKCIKNRLTRSEIIQCEEQILKGLDYNLPTREYLTQLEVQELCYNYEKELFLVEQ